MRMQKHKSYIARLWKMSQKQVMQDLRNQIGALRIEERLSDLVRSSDTDDTDLDIGSPLPDLVSSSDTDDADTDGDIYETPFKYTDLLNRVSAYFDRYFVIAICQHFTAQVSSQHRRADTTLEKMDAARRMLEVDMGLDEANIKVRTAYIVESTWVLWHVDVRPTQKIVLEGMDHSKTDFSICGSKKPTWRAKDGQMPTANEDDNGVRSPLFVLVWAWRYVLWD